MVVRRERVSTPDGDFLDLDWHEDHCGPLVILLHGLTGSSRSPYIKGMQSALSLRGYRSVALNFRGCSGSPNQTWKAYHSGETHDLRFLIRRLRANESNTALMAVGFSLGGNVLLKYLGEEGDRSGLSAAVAVSSPLKIAKCATRLDSGLSRLYRNQLIRELKDYLATKIDFLLETERFEDAARLMALGSLDGVKSFWDYDDRVVARLYGFNGAEDYYARSSSFGYLNDITTPSLIIQSLDDPFLTPDVLPQPHEHSTSVQVHACEHGGHVGFVGGETPWRPQYWLEERICNYLDEWVKQTL